MIRKWLGVRYRFISELLNKVERWGIYLQIAALSVDSQRKVVDYPHPLMGN
jgi:hypothetical protein